MYTKQYCIEADSMEEAKKIVRNGLSMIEFHNFTVEDVKEIGNEH